jgi:hypothetical protein
VAKPFGANKGVKGSGASSRRYIPELLPDLLNGTLDVPAILTEELSLADIAEDFETWTSSAHINVLITRATRSLPFGVLPPEASSLLAAR